jgi:hypothetical protein
VPVAEGCKKEASLAVVLDEKRKDVLVVLVLVAAGEPVSWLLRPAEEKGKEEEVRGKINCVRLTGSDDETGAMLLEGADDAKVAATDDVPTGMTVGGVVAAAAEDLTSTGCSRDNNNCCCPTALAVDTACGSRESNSCCPCGSKIR